MNAVNKRLGSTVVLPARLERVFSVFNPELAREKKPKTTWLRGSQDLGGGLVSE